ncbi:MAG: DNA-binding protein WhiA [Lachnospiraceae bacterium]|jgi:cell division protein WhiA|nr:DNA-binding protein WhiA [Lachnospiraceae bacterium]MCI6408386.1 DNA-binding protein WhiA [Lachnospiraceae bacterium]MCI6978252.1 DNA-binding protein WhiA [Lachnospiraceae bacterium]MDD6579789.1 DNA-binding protein WhiA [Lachnospiraceae bacterium]MDD7222869.1 DNA-binding protein WhiA [Lachnospiraceae bacterium]
MSFSSIVKEELSKKISGARHCQIAELAAIYSFCGSFVQKNKENSYIFFNFENVLVANKCFTLMKKAFTIYSGCDFVNQIAYDEKSLTISVNDKELCEKIQDALESFSVTERTCCRRAYLRGAYLCGGSTTDPGKSYHLEIVCKNKKSADKIIELFETFDVDAKLVERGRYYIVYIKDSNKIVLALNVFEAPVALMEYENTIIMKEMRNSINRQNNCDVANLNKTVSAAQSVISDIKQLMGTAEYENLPDNIKEVAMLRVEYPDASLKELGEMLTPPLGKSGVNHRLRKLSEMARKRS